ncbi:MAG TPA: hypothetical protein ENI27_06060 [bacterium]|nr:hypothetical protein [bacterium]
MSMLELYKALKLPVKATLPEVKAAYRQFAKRHHPDTAAISRSSELFISVTQKYQNYIRHYQKNRLLQFPNPKKTGPMPQESPRPNIRIVQFKLGKMLASDPHPTVRAFAASSLGNSGKKSAYAYLRKSLDEKNNLVLKAVIKAIGKLRIYQSAGEMGALFVHSKLEIKKLILDMAGDMGKGFNNIFIAGMKDKDSGIRRKSVNLFARHNG